MQAFSFKINKTEVNNVLELFQMMYLNKIPSNLMRKIVFHYKILIIDESRKILIKRTNGRKSVV